MRLRTCNNRRRAQARHATTRASLKRVWKRLNSAFPTAGVVFRFRSGPIVEGAPIDWKGEAMVHVSDALRYGISAMKDGKRIAPEDLYVEPQP